MILWDSHGDGKAKSTKVKKEGIARLGGSHNAETSDGNKARRRCYECEAFSYES